MCCRGQERRGRGGDLLLLLLLLLVVRLVWLPLRPAAEAAELLLPFTSCAYFSLLRVPEWVERSWRLSSPPPPEAYRDLLGLEQAAALPFPLDLLGALTHDIFSNLQTSSLDSFMSGLVLTWF